MHQRLLSPASRQSIWAWSITVAVPRALYWALPLESSKTTATAPSTLGVSQRPVPVVFGEPSCHLGVNTNGDEVVHVGKADLLQVHHSQVPTAALITPSAYTQYVTMLQNQQWKSPRVSSFERPPACLPKLLPKNRSSSERASITDPHVFWTPNQTHSRQTRLQA